MNSRIEERDGMKSFKNLILYAFRYAIGRKSYAVGEVASYLVEHWDLLSKHLQELICEEIRVAIEKSLAGDMCDEAEWARVVRRHKQFLSEQKVTPPL